MGWEDPLEEGMVTHSSILPWKIPWTREPGGLQSMGLGKSWTQLSDQTTTQLHYKVIITYHKYIYIPVILLQIRLNQRSEKYKIVLLYL